MEITIREAKQAIAFNLDNGIRRAILMLGAPGIGKSDIVREICEERGIGFIDLRLLLYAEVDLKGIPVPDKDTGTTRWFPNDILPSVEKDGPRGILLIDEITSAPKRVQAAAYQLIQDYQLGEYKVPDGWLIVSAGNREDDDGVYVQMPSPLADRFEILKVRPDFDIWKADFAYKNNVNSDVIAYLNFKPNALHTQKPGESSLEFCTPRSWVAVSNILNSADFKDKLTQIKVAGNIGDIETAGFKEFMRYKDSLVSADQVLSGMVKVPPEEKSQQCLIISTLSSKMSYLKDKKSLESEDEEKLTNICNFFMKMRAEMMALGLKDLISVAPKLVRTFIKLEFDSPEMLTFMQKNKYLFTE